MIPIILCALALLVQTLVGTGLLYHYFLLLMGGAPRRSADSPGQAGFRFAVVIPAHNEERVIGRTIARLRQMDYPSDRFDIHVIADYCSDATAQEAHSAGAIVHERSEGPRGRKGYALAWLLPHLLETERYGAVVIFDADSHVSGEFLSLMDRALAGGALAVQGRHAIANPGAGVFSALADADMRLNNRIRGQAKENLELSARLMGDAMCFHRDVLARHPFGAGSLTEDREYELQLVLDRVRVRFAPEAVSIGQAAARWGDATGQRLRWYSGGFELQKRYLGPLLRAAAQDRSLDAVDRIAELCLPPFSVLSALAVGLLVVQVALGAYWALPSRLVTAGLAMAAVLYPFLGLVAEQAPWHTFRVLLFGPIYVAWRVWLGLAVRVRRRQVTWIRTRRMEEGGPRK